MKKRNLKFQGTLLLVGILSILIYSVTPNTLNQLDLFKYEFNPWTDQGSGGNSRVSSMLQNPGLSFEWELGNKIKNPWAGVGFQFADIHKEGQFFNLSKFDTLEMEIESNINTEINIQILTYDDRVTNSDQKNTFRHLTKEIPLKKGSNHINFLLNTLYTPDWWFTQNKVNKDWNQKHLGKTFEFAFIPGYNQKVGEIVHIKFKKMELRGYSNRGFGYLVFFILFLIILSLGWRKNH